MTRKILLVVMMVAPTFFACDGGDSAPTAPPSPPPPPAPNLGVSFAEAEFEIREGKTLGVRVLYEAQELAAPVQIGLTASNDNTSTADYELSPGSVEIPAGKNLAGEVAFELSALSDLFFNEGTETLSLALVVSNASAILGGPVEVSILEAGARPCSGITVIGLPWREEKSQNEDFPSMLATTLSLEIGVGSGTRLEILGPYLDLGSNGRIAESISVFGINRWSVRSNSESIIHELDVNWSGEDWFEEESPKSFDLAFLDGGCSGRPIASCTSDGCEIIP